MTLSSLSPDAAGAQTDGELMLTGFASSSSGLGWYVVNDNVMGGRSDGDFVLEKGELRFTGRTNTNGGGFSSIRTKPLQLDLSQYTGIRLKVKGDGRRYTWRLATNARWRGREISYWSDFDTEGGTWVTVDIPFSSFVPRFRGNQLDGPALDTQQINGMGLMIYDNLDGPFKLNLASVRAYSARAPFSLRQYQWKKRVLVLSAPSDDEKNLAEQLAAVALTRDDFEERDMALVILRGNEISTAGDRALTAEESAMARAALGIRPESFALRLIGKDGTIKQSSDRATPMSEIYALVDTMPMRQGEKPNN